MRAAHRQHPARTPAGGARARGTCALAALSLGAVLGAVLGACAAVRSPSRPAAAAARPDLVLATYDPDVDSTRVRTALIPLGGGLVLYAGFNYAGEVLTAAPAQVSLVFRQSSAAPRWQEPRGRSLTLVLNDTARLEVEDTRYRRYVVTSRGPVAAKVTEWVWAALPLREFEQVAGAARVDGTLARTRFTLDAEQLAALRELARRIAPEGAGR